MKEKSAIHHIQHTPDPKLKKYINFHTKSILFFDY